MLNSFNLPLCMDDSAVDLYRAIQFQDRTAEL